MTLAIRDLQLSVVRYTSDQKIVWDSFVAASRNGTFLFMRDYMDYHADRFTDYSLMFYKGGRLLALLPGNMEAQDRNALYERTRSRLLHLRHAASGRRARHHVGPYCHLSHDASG